MDRQTINELRLRSFSSAPEIAFVCECANDDCRRTVTLTPEAYGRLREDAQAVLFPGHTGVEASAPISTA
jgi:hypothetical protein